MRKGVRHAATDANEISQGAQGPHPWRCHECGYARLRPVRAQGAGAGTDHRAPDRGGAPRADAPHEALRPGLDPLFPDVPVSKKPLEVRMGSGKGAPEFWVARVKPGRILFEIDGVPVQVAKESLALAAAKLPIKTRFVERISE